MKYLKEFETQAAYDAAESSLLLPNVSLVTENNTVHYKPLQPTGHSYVEINGVKWATMNVGAESITDAGLYFQWGDTQGYTADEVGQNDGQKYFGWTDYKYGDSTMSKYNSTDNLITLQASDDAVTAAWGGNWRMPTTAEFQALGNAVNTAWTQVNGVYGLRCEDKTDSSKVLFFPAVGYAELGSVVGVGSDGKYWSSSLHSSYVKAAYRLFFLSNAPDWYNSGERYYGCPVRGILDV